MLLLSQHLVVALAFAAIGCPVTPDAGFWLLPLRRLTFLPGLPMGAAVLAFAFSLIVAWLLAVLSFRRAAQSRGGYALSAFAIVPAIQIPAVLILAMLPSRPIEREDQPEAGARLAHVLQGVLAGMAIIVGAVLVSAVAFGVYGWGLFVLTPFLVGVTTAYLANRHAPLEKGRTVPLVMAAAALGTLALILFALEGLVCILLASPLGAVAALGGGALGRTLALGGQGGNKPLMSIAILPAMFAFEAAMPRALPIATYEQVDIDSPPGAVWQALISDRRIASSPGLIRLAGLAYPIRGRLLGTGVDAEREGMFSTGTAIERVPGRRLAFTVVSQPPAIDEMSPYRRVHASHVSGYFTTTDTRFSLVPLPRHRTRLTAQANHMLRIDPVLYWEPLARWAIHANVMRVLGSIRDQAEQAPPA